MNLRKIHTWASVLLIVPILIVGGTAILIAHDTSLGTKEVHLPIAADAPAREKALLLQYEVRAVATGAEGAVLYATKYGLMRSENGAAPVDAGLPYDLRDLDRLDSGALVAAAKEGLFVQSPSQDWTKVANGEFRSLSRQTGGGFLATADDRVWRVSVHGIARPDPTFGAPLQAGAALGVAPPYTLAKLVMDLHTGKFFFGKTWEWIWIDLVGGAMVLLGITGIVIWRRSEKAKARQAEAKLVPRDKAFAMPAE
ncbi:MAG: PepSY domain-containing protein [Pseudotabrizicola sp.]|uniref:PepSY domain-containing protein n=1 Tax=Pseudotabrizicola sp. TaxID=2939647 RepID=UPI00272732C7|nr:PepSY domain-containing protein [Pseudotabrizicola sp.]MDO9637344.1 PepSY domain-containing protein [Pseudotabrizicola sp.]